MTKNRVITIGREFGSGGHEIGNLVATRLDIPLYDNNLVRMVADKLDIRQETAQAVDETTLNSFLKGFVFSSMEYTASVKKEEYAKPLSEQVYELQAEIIKKLAERGPGVFVGRCADYVLKDQAECINIFICADMDDRIARIVERYNLSERKAADKIKKVDRERRYYYEARTGLFWGDIDSHDMMFNVSRLGIERTADIIETIYKMEKS
ncbi:cytidylate kinase-like family protein [Lachnospiraceae bacterium 42-17]|nr:cytidylate kinase-like family protein [Dorea sp.]